MLLRRRQLAWSLLALAQPGRAQMARPVRVLASFSILADLLRNVGGDAVQVSALVGPNADAHVFEPTPADVRRVAETELVAINGLGFEGWLTRLLQAAGYRGPVATATDGIAPRLQGLTADPHAWQDLNHARRYVANLQTVLTRLLPAAAGGMAQRAQAYTARLAALDLEVRRGLAAVPAPHRRVITAHDAFGYFGAAYGVDFSAAQGINTHSEPSAAAVARLIEQIRSQGVRAVFVENISDPRLVERIAHEGGVTLGGRLHTDALSAPGTEADTYLKLFAHNARTLTAAMLGRRPA